MRISVGIDIAKEVHWVTAVDADGRVLLDRKLENTAADIGRLVGGARGARRRAPDRDRSSRRHRPPASAPCCWPPACALVHVPGLAVNRARQGTVGGRHKSDPRDARVIADQVRMRAGDLRPIALEDDTARRAAPARRPPPRSRHRPDPARQPHARPAQRHPSRPGARPRPAPSRAALAAHPLRHRRRDPRRRAEGHRASPARQGRARPRGARRGRLAAARAHPDLQLPAEAVTAALVRELAAEALAARARIAALDRGSPSSSPPP